MNASGHKWIEALPDELAGQKALLRRLLAECEARDSFSWLVVACSVGRGAADRLSDLDMGMGLRDEVFDTALGELREVIDGLGDLIDSYRHQIAGRGVLHERIFAQYADRCQIDLVAIPASQTIGAVRDEVLLYGADMHQVELFEQQAPTAGQLREWAFGGWCALADVGKYLRRGSAWEALQRLNEARDHAWRLWAAVLDVRNPQYGLTSILDFAPDELPAAMDDTVSGLGQAGLLAAARSLAGQLTAAGDRLPAPQRELLPAAMGRFITGDLAGIATAGGPAPSN
jgi:hypothetical protein